MTIVILASFIRYTVINVKLLKLRNCKYYFVTTFYNIKMSCLDTFKRSRNPIQFRSRGLSIMGCFTLVLMVTISGVNSTLSIFSPLCQIDVYHEYLSRTWWVVIALYKAVCDCQASSSSYAVLSCTTPPSLGVTSILPASLLAGRHHIFPRVSRVWL